MQLSLNEIRSRAATLARDWRDDPGLERQEAQTFWNEFFNVFGVSRRRVASFEVPVRNLFSSTTQSGRIDLLWKGRLLAEHKSRGQNLDRAATQARDYFDGLKDRDLPRLTVVSDFERIRVYDNDLGNRRSDGASDYVEFSLSELPSRIGLFGVLSGYETRSFSIARPVDGDAARGLRALHDSLRDTGYDGHPLEVLMVRLLFCLFADNAGVWEPGLFRDWLDARTDEDGSDLGPLLNRVFAILDTTTQRRSTILDETLAALPHVNGSLFKERHDPADFNGKMRSALLDLSRLDWPSISPEIFGALFQGIRTVRDRRATGEFYTSETNIRKALNPLFLDALRAEFTFVKRDQRGLANFHAKLSSIRVLDPACGCGNFLVVAYRELRLLELEVLKARYSTGIVSMPKILSQVRVEQFSGIEMNEWPAQIARVAMWLTDHQMNLKVSDEFSRLELRFPLGEGAAITVGNALLVDWGTAAGGIDAISYIVGNPPFIGGKMMAPDQRTDVARVWGKTKNAGLLDYVTCWYALCARLMRVNPAIECALVSTNSITQGEQPGVLWTAEDMRGVRINFAHRTFRWASGTVGTAAVHCVIMGFSREDRAEKTLYDYLDPNSDPIGMRATIINPYLVDAPVLTLANRSRPIASEAPAIGIGNKPIDGGWYLFKPQERADFCRDEPQAAPYFRRWIGSDEFLYGIERWFLWLRDAKPEVIRHMPLARERIESVQKFRRGEEKGKNGRTAKDAGTAALAKTPTRLHVENVPNSRYFVIPKVSSENRFYIPMAFVDPETLSSDLLFILPTATLYDFGVLTSHMHMAWVRAVCGRLESRYRYSSGIVYNNFPWPVPTAIQRGNIEKAAQSILNARVNHSISTLATLYDPALMPADIAQAHTALDRAVDNAYGPPKGGWTVEATRLAFLFTRHATLTTPIVPPVKSRKRPSRKQT